MPCHLLRDLLHPTVLRHHFDVRLGNPLNDELTGSLQLKELARGCPPSVRWLDPVAGGLRISESGMNVVSVIKSEFLYLVACVFKGFLHHIKDDHVEPLI